MQPFGVRSETLKIQLLIVQDWPRERPADLQNPRGWKPPSPLLPFRWPDRPSIAREVTTRFKNPVDHYKNT